MSRDSRSVTLSSTRQMEQAAKDLNSVADFISVG